MEELIRYSIIERKNPREIILLRGSGCKWRKCRFCDYHKDFSKNEEANFLLNKTVIDQVTGIYKSLEVINSGSFSDLDLQTMEYIFSSAKIHKIENISFECHWKDRSNIKPLKEKLRTLNISSRFKIGVESFDYDFREKILVKGLNEHDPQIISEHYDDCCLLAGIHGQNELSMKRDIETGLKYFKRVCVNLMTSNTAPLQPDFSVCEVFKEKIMPLYINNPRVDILIENTDFGVGGIKNA